MHTPVQKSCDRKSCDSKGCDHKGGCPMGWGRSPQRSWLKAQRFWLKALSGAALCLLQMEGSVLAQIRPDNTLPRSTVVQRQNNTFVITGGSQAGQNLFHSFREFSVPRNGRALFQGVDPATVRTIFSRITGSEESRIDGLVEIRHNGRISPVNLFLLNPNGILFGAGASINIGGSFVATTAESIRFQDGFRFDAVNPQTSALLTVSAPIGLQFGQMPGRIVNRSIEPLRDEFGNPVRGSFDGISDGVDLIEDIILGLSVPTGKTLALVGGDLLLQESFIRVDGGRVELGSVSGAGEVSLTPIAAGWRLGYSRVPALGNIQLTQSTLVDTSGTQGGAIQIQAGRLAISGGAQIVSSTIGQPGDAITVRAREAIDLVGQSPDGFNSGIFTGTIGAGAAGDVSVSTQRLSIRDLAVIESYTASSGRGGDLSVRADAIEVIGSIGPSSSLITTQSLSQADDAGRAGNLSIRTRQLRLEAGAQISASTFGAGNAGNLVIQAEEIDLQGLARTPAGEPILVEGRNYPSGLFAGTGIPDNNVLPSGNGGQLRINTQRLNLADGAVIQNVSLGSGDAGALLIRAQDSVTVSGIVRTATNRYPSGIVAYSGGLPGAGFPRESRATGAGGDATLITNRLTIQDGAVVAVSSVNPAAPGAGRLRIEAPIVLLDNQGRLDAETESGTNDRNANITFEGTRLLVLRRGSNITSAAGQNSGRGEGGNIRFNAETRSDSFIVASPTEDSNVVADAVQQNAGNVTINANVIGITPRQNCGSSCQTPQSDITASSQQGISGNIAVSGLQVDPSRGLIELPTDVTDAAQLVAQQCGVSNQATNRLGEFVVTGRGGLPPNPEDARSSEPMLTDWASVEARSTEGQNPNVRVILETVPSADTPGLNAIARPKTKIGSTPPPAPIAEAQGWMLGPNGEIMLVAQAPAGTPQSPSIQLPGCDRATAVRPNSPPDSAFSALQSNE